MEEYRKYEPIFGSWYLSRLLGKGSFGKVFEITREEFGTTYRSALKIISVPQDDDDIKTRMAEATDLGTITEYYEGILKEIVNENEIMAQLKGNSNIVSYEDHQIIPHDDGIGYDILIRMELLTPLIDRMVEKKLDEKEVVRLGIDMCKALELCHKKNIIHRDIKPQNIFISENGDFKLGDFGIARTMEKTSGGMSKKGTYKYMAPEVFKGENYDSTVDIYSLGIVLYTLLNGNRGPFLPAPPAKVTHNDEEEARMRRFRGEPLPIPAEAGVMLSYIIGKACNANPQNRYRTAKALRRDLENYLKNYMSQPETEATGAADEGTVLEFDQMRRYTGQYNVRNQDDGATVLEEYPMPYPGGIKPNPVYTGSIPAVAVSPAYDQYTPVQNQGYSPKGRGKGKKFIIGAAACGILLLAGLIVLAVNLISGPKGIDFADLMSEPAVDGYDGYGYVSRDIMIDAEKRDKLLDRISSDEKDKVAELLDGMHYEVENSTGLSNGDEVKITAVYDSDLASDLETEISNDETSFEAEGLKELPEYIKRAENVGTVRFFRSTGHFYMLCDPQGGIYWTGANAACGDLNGHLVTVLNETDESIIETIIEENGTLYHYWLGASDAESEGNWRWVTGERVPLSPYEGYEKWCGNQPNNKQDYEPVGQDYMEIQKTYGDQGPEEYMTWTDIGDSGEAGTRFYGAPDYNETRYYGYICEWDMEN